MGRKRGPRGHPPLDRTDEEEDPLHHETMKRNGTVAGRRAGPKGEDRPHGP